ncbi:MAG TPA: histidine kinase [Cytophagaceae bacterium]
MFSYSKRTIKWIAHLLYWLGYWLFTIDYMVKWAALNSIPGSYYKGVLYSSAYICIFMLFVYVNYFFAFPKYFLSKKFIAYAVAVLLSAGVGVLIKVNVDLLFLPSRPAWAYGWEHYASSILPFSFNYILVTLLCLIEAWMGKLKSETQLKNSQLEAELKWLKTQIDPHFLFNALNNIYTLTYLQSEEAAPKILKLSEMMRYMLEDANLPSVPIEKEIAYLQNYIGLHKMKKKKSDNIVFEVNSNASNCLIEPLLFINFVENCFKHSAIESDDSWIRIYFTVFDDKIIFIAENTVHVRNTSSRQKIGINNALKRLDLLYPGQHKVNITSNDNTYKVLVELKRHRLKMGTVIK